MNPADKKHPDLIKVINDKARRKLHAKEEGQQSVWAGLGLFGLIGWSIVAPTLAGAALGLWLDHNHPQPFSWTLSFLVLGLFIGCLLAWQWVKGEHKEINQGKND